MHNPALQDTAGLRVVHFGSFGDGSEGESFDLHCRSELSDREGRNHLHDLISNSVSNLRQPEIRILIGNNS